VNEPETATSARTLLSAIITSGAAARIAAAIPRVDRSGNTLQRPAVLMSYPQY